MKFQKALKFLVSISILLSLSISSIDIQASEQISNDFTQASEKNTETVKAEAITYVETENSITDQMNELYKTVAEQVGINEKFVGILHKLAGGTATYSMQSPSIYNEETIKELRPPMKIDGAKTIYRQADFIECNDKSIERPSKYYIPDALYSVSLDIKEIMDKRKSYYKSNTSGKETASGYRRYFNNLTDEAKENVLFYESLLEYTGEETRVVRQVLKAYISIASQKKDNEKVVYEETSGKIRFTDKYERVLKNLGITSPSSIQNMATMISFDSLLASSNSYESISKDYKQPFELNTNKRETMMIAAASVVGKVRYVWGGGHQTTCQIDGINPAWSQFEKTYETEEEHRSYCIKSHDSWCPIHGFTDITFHGDIVKSASEYLGAREDLFSNTDNKGYDTILNQINYNDYTNEHFIDGLDCSGFVSWVYNQITSSYRFDSCAKTFANQYGVNRLKLGTELKPGDAFSWLAHITMVVGQIREGSKAYLMIEQTPNKVRYGCLYYDGASYSDIQQAVLIAREANELLGGIDSSLEPPHCYNMNTIGEYRKKVKIKNKSTKKKESSETKKKSSDVKKKGSANKEDKDIEDSENDADNKISESDSNLEEDIKEQDQSNNKKDETNYENEKEHKEKDKDTSEKKNKKKYKYVTKNFTMISRFGGTFEDKPVYINGKTKTFENITALEILRYTITKLPIQYISGYGTYNGSLFDIGTIGTNLKD